MQPTENPYASPSAAIAPTPIGEEARQLDQQLAIAKRVTRLPALGMLACSVVSSLLFCVPLMSITLLGIQKIQIHWLGRHVASYWPLYLTPFTFYFTASFFGSLSLLKCQHRTLAKIGCFFSLMPLVHPLFPLAIPFALKGLAAMRNPDVDLAFRRAELDERSNRTRALAQLFGPASIFLMLSCMTMFCIVMPVLVSIVVYPYFNPGGAAEFMRIVKTTVAPRMLVAASGALFLGYAAAQMLRGRQYWVCVIAAGSSLIPFFTPCFLLGIPFGLWALVILLQKDTRAAFTETDP